MNIIFGRSFSGRVLFCAEDLIVSREIRNDKNRQSHSETAGFLLTATFFVFQAGQAMASQS